MSRILAVVIALIALILLAVVGVQWLTPRIEEDLANRVNQSFAEKGLLFADAEVQGREVTVLGDAPDTDAHDKALSAAAQVFGVAKVSDGMSIAGVMPEKQMEITEITIEEEGVVIAESPRPYTLTITKDDETVTLQGVVGDSASRKVLARLATDRYGVENVTDEMKVVEGAPEGWRSAAAAVLFNLTNLEEATATLSNTEVMVSGEALDEEYISTAESSMKKALPTSYRLAFAVDLSEQAVLMAKAEDAKQAATSVTERVLAAVTPSAGPQEADEAGTEEDTPAQDAANEPSGNMLSRLWTGGGNVATCNQSEDLRIHKVMFSFDSAKIADVYKPTVEQVASIIKGCDRLGVAVEGHTDRTGSDLYNQWLSEQRAESGVRALMRTGIARERIESVGYGESRPVASNETRQGRAANRRIEFVPEMGGLFSGSQQEKEEITTEDKPETTSGTSWWDRISGAINRAETAVSETVNPSAGESQ